jgi:hypothetical protein
MTRAPDFPPDEGDRAFARIIIDRLIASAAPRPPRACVNTEAGKLIAEIAAIDGRPEVIGHLLDRDLIDKDPAPDA